MWEPGVTPRFQLERKAQPYYLSSECLSSLQGLLEPHDFLGGRLKTDLLHKLPCVSQGHLGQAPSSAGTQD